MIFKGLRIVKEPKLFDEFDVVCIRYRLGS